jgi:hypothetical protein
MKGYKNSTKTVYETEASAKYAKGGPAKTFASKPGAKKDMAQDKATAGKAVHKHERAMHPGKPLTKMQKGGKVGC